MLKTLKALFITAAFIYISTSSAIAVMYPDRAGICYMFKGSKLQSKGLCMISISSGAGARMVDLDFKGKKHELHRVNNQTTLNNKSAQDYLRHPETLKKVNNDEYGMITNPYPIECFKSKTLEICYNQP